jgi:NosR/NirI family transcriptional regulator, nitrous oxide reductase regulator
MPIHDAEAERAAQMALIERIWWDRASRSRAGRDADGADRGVLLPDVPDPVGRATYWFRMGFLSFTLVFLGWYAAAQLSVVNLLALVASLREGFSWQAFMLDPLTFILWWAVAAALIFWGRGAYCGWLCPFGALQELTNQIAARCKCRRSRCPGACMNGCGRSSTSSSWCCSASLAAVALGKPAAEVEPFKTAIVLKFDRAWPFVPSRWCCCSSGCSSSASTAAICARWARRWRSRRGCGCSTGSSATANAAAPARPAPTNASCRPSTPTGEINPNECLNCLNCQVLYQSTTKCPVVIRQLKRREAVAGGPLSARAPPCRGTRRPGATP